MLMNRGEKTSGYFPSASEKRIARFNLLQGFFDNFLEISVLNLRSYDSQGTG